MSGRRQGGMFVALAVIFLGVTSSSGWTAMPTTQPTSSTMTSASTTTQQSESASVSEKIPFRFGEPMKIDVASKPVTACGYYGAIVLVDKARFVLENGSHARGALGVEIRWVANVNYPLQVRLLDRNGVELGAATQKVHVERFILKERFVTWREVQFDFGTSERLKDAAMAVVTIGEPEFADRMKGWASWCGNTVATQSAGPVPGAMAFRFGETLCIEALWDSAEKDGRVVFPAGVYGVTLFLDSESRVCGVLRTSSDVDDLFPKGAMCRTHVALFDKAGRLLGTASHERRVRGPRVLGGKRVIGGREDAAIDFGVSKRFKDAATVAIAVSQPDFIGSADSSTQPTTQTTMPSDASTSAVVVPGAVAFRFGEPVTISPFIVGSACLMSLRMSAGTFTLDQQSRMTCAIPISFARRAEGDYWIYLAVFDRSGHLLGVANHNECVVRAVTDVAPLSQPRETQDIVFDFGVSKRFADAAAVVMAVTQPEMTEMTDSTIGYETRSVPMLSSDDLPK